MMIPNLPQVIVITNILYPVAAGRQAAGFNPFEASGANTGAGKEAAQLELPFDQDLQAEFCLLGGSCLRQEERPSAY